jgi:2-phosphosulfolactate phosphatase
MKFDQSAYEVRCEWGLRGLRELAPSAGAIVIVDVLSFTTSLDIATERGAMVFPYPQRGDAAAAYAASVGAELASSIRGEGLSLSPVSLRGIARGCRLVLPSPNGATLAFAATSGASVIAACLRNACAAAARAQQNGSPISVIPAGETWDTGELRPCLEDLAGAGAVIAGLRGTKSPEALLAQETFERLRPKLLDALRECSSGRELIEWGFADDVALAAEVDASTNVPVLRGRAFEGS